MLPRLSLLGKVAFFAAGGVAVAVAWKAPDLGLDPNRAWGAARRAVLAIGLLMISVPILDALAHRALGWTRGRYARRPTGMGQGSAQGSDENRLDDLSNGFESRDNDAVDVDARAPRWARARAARQRETRGPGRTRLAAWGMVLAWLLVVAVYAWIGSVGRWIDWPATTHYYDMLGEAFLGGSLALNIEPDPALAQLENPYDPRARAGIPYLVDASYFDGKYYLYWGPLPALLAAAVKLFVDVEVGEPYLVFLGVCLSALFGSLSLLHLWRSSFRRAGWWSVPLFVLALGLANPMPWLMGRPAIYEAAVAMGQANLLGGLYLLLPVFLGEPARAGRLAAGSLLLGFAVASRVPLLLAVIVLVSTALARLWLRWGWSAISHAPWGRLLAVAGPLALCLAVLGWYNWARFGSPVEFGQRYAMASVDLQPEALASFSFRYLPANLYNYLLRPLRTLSVFPFVKPVWGLDHVPYLGLRVDTACYPLQVTGMLVAVPFLWFLLVPAFGLLLEPGPAARLGSGGNASTRAKTTLGILMAATAAASLPILAYCASTMHYLADFTPLAILSSALVAWLYLTRARTGRSEALVVGVAVLLVAAAGILGFLLGVSGYSLRFETLNPELFDRITRLLAW